MDFKKDKKILVSGVQSSGQLHIANYFGAIKQIIELVNSGEYESYIFLADYHSMTTLTNKEERLKNTLESLASYLALGMDKNKVNIFKQSDVPEVTELTWIFNTVTPIPMLFLAHAFKDKVGNNKEDKINLDNLKNINVGLFNYPVLMAADILIYNADIVPVGKDQEQHIEYAREIAGKYNRSYNTNTFKEPKAFIKKDTGTIIGIDGLKMSKSKNNILPIFASNDDIKKKIMSIKTDSLSPLDKKYPDNNNIYNIHKLFLDKNKDKELRNKFLNSDKIPYSYKEAKEELYETFINYFSSSQKKFDYYTKTEKGKKELMKIIKIGAKRANKKAQETLKKVKEETGLNFS